jgi:hypothetical protein
LTPRQFFSRSDDETAATRPEILATKNSWRVLAVLAAFGGLAVQFKGCKEQQRDVATTCSALRGGAGFAVQKKPEHAGECSALGILQ